MLYVDFSFTKTAASREKEDFFWSLQNLQIQISLVPCLYIFVHLTRHLPLSVLFLSQWILQCASPDRANTRKFCNKRSAPLFKFLLCHDRSQENEVGTQNCSLGVMSLWFKWNKFTLTSVELWSPWLVLRVDLGDWNLSKCWHLLFIYWLMHSVFHRCGLFCTTLLKKMPCAPVCRLEEQEMKKLAEERKREKLEEKLAR